MFSMNGGSEIQWRERRERERRERIREIRETREQLLRRAEELGREVRRKPEPLEKE